MNGKQCKKCGAHIPRAIWIENKRRNLQTRKYCFECSPFGHHNTSILEKYDSYDGMKVCPECKKPHKQKSHKCFSCYYQDRKKTLAKKVENLVGSSCWICGYGKCKRNIAFHHVDSSNKFFSLSARELMLKWDRVFAEMKKCVFVCHNCHGEIHEGLIKPEQVLQLQKSRWEQIIVSSP